MNDQSMTYHREREQQCRALAEEATDPDVRRRHQQLADLHADAAAERSGHPA